MDLYLLKRGQVQNGTFYTPLSFPLGNLLKSGEWYPESPGIEV